MRLVHCDNLINGCDVALDEYAHETNHKWISAHRGRGHGAPHAMGPWHLCSWACAEEFFASKKTTEAM